MDEHEAIGNTTPSSYLMKKDTVKPVATIDQDNGNHPDLGIHIVAGGTDDRSGIAEGDGEGRRNSLIAPNPNISQTGNQLTGRSTPTCNMDSGTYVGDCTNAWWEYTFNFPNATTYSAGIISSNDSRELRDLSIVHHVKVSLDGVYKGDINNPAAANTVPQTGRVSLGSVTAGNHVIKYEWDNDQSGPGWDSNIRIYNTFIDDWVDAPALNVVSYNADYTVGGFGNTYEFRYRVKDNAGNWSDWAYDGSVTTSTFQSLSVDLTANKTSGPAPLTGVALTANVGGSAAGTINYTFYCNRGDIPPTAGLVGYWKFDENSGTAVQDFSTTAANGTWNGTGTHWTTEKIRSAGAFNGTNDYVNVVRNGKFNLSGSAFTVSMWAKDDTSVADLQAVGLYHRFISWYDGSKNIQVGLAFDRCFYVQNDNADSVPKACSAINQPYGYHHVVATYDGVSAYKVYTDGVYTSGTPTGTATPYTGDSTNLFIGQRGNGAYTNGSIDEVRIYNRALSPTEILQLYNYTGTQITLPADHKPDNTSTNPYSAPANTCDAVYNFTGNYTAKVIAERGGLAAENWLPITVTNAPPSADTFGVVNSDFCAPNVNYSFSWIYRDPNNDPEFRYDFQIAKDVGFSNIVVSRSFSGLSNPVNTTNTQAVLVVPQNPPPADYLTYGQNYWWRVRVWDNWGANSGWLPQPPIPFNPPHRYPVCDFTYTPQYPNVKEKVDFSDNSTCYDDVSIGAACAPANGDTFTWTFPDGTPANSSAESPQDVIFNPYGVKNVVLTVNDGIFSCSKTIPVNIRFPLPAWKEVKPQ